MKNENQVNSDKKNDSPISPISPVSDEETTIKSSPATRILLTSENLTHPGTSTERSLSKTPSKLARISSTSFYVLKFTAHLLVEIVTRATALTVAVGLFALLCLSLIYEKSYRDRKAMSEDLSPVIRELLSCGISGTYHPNKIKDLDLGKDVEEKRIQSMST